MFNYKCEECQAGIVRDVEKKNYKVTVDNVEFYVPTAIIGVCDQCGAVNYSGEELHRWQELYKAWQVKSDKYISPGQIRQIRDKLGLNQGQFSDFLGISRQALSAWESKKRAQVQPPNIDIILRILLSELEQLERPVTEKMFTEYQRRCSKEEVPTPAASQDREKILEQILPASTYSILRNKASENNTTPLTEVIRLAESCYFTDHLAQFMIDSIKQTPLPVDASRVFTPPKVKVSSDYQFNLSEGQFYVSEPPQSKRTAQNKKR